jgi:NADH-quinone oxidoreductase subunit J
VVGLFYVAAPVAILATLLALTRANVVHGLLYLVVSLLAVAVVFFTLGAPFVAALEAIVYAGAIIVLFVFVVMMLGLGDKLRAAERGWAKRTAWAGPALLCAVLAAALVGRVGRAPSLPELSGTVTAQRVGTALYGPYLVGVELASMLLLGALVGAHHLGRRSRPEEEGHDAGYSDGTRPDAGHDSLRAGTGRPVDPPQPDVRSHGA